MGLFTKRQPGQFARRAPIVGPAHLLDALEKLTIEQQRTNELLEQLVRNGARQPPGPSGPPPGPAAPARHGRA